MLLLTKALAVEGTSILARDFPQRLRDLGMDDVDIARCQEFLTNPGISVLKEARIAASYGSITAMHDVTEGGLSTALQELSCAGGHRIRVILEQIPVYAETGKLCRLLGLNPLGLIGSGSLLIVCRAPAAEGLAAALKEAAIDAVCLGEVLQSGIGVEAVNANGDPVPWPQFEADEIARVYVKGLNSAPAPRTAC
jgi:hydrogenase maturation factor